MNACRLQILFATLFNDDYYIVILSNRSDFTLFERTESAIGYQVFH